MGGMISIFKATTTQNGRSEMSGFFFQTRFLLLRGGMGECCSVCVCVEFHDDQSLDNDEAPPHGEICNQARMSCEHELCWCYKTSLPLN